MSEFQITIRLNAEERDQFARMAGRLPHSQQRSNSTAFAAICGYLEEYQAKVATLQTQLNTALDQMTALEDAKYALERENRKLEFKNAQIDLPL